MGNKWEPTTRGRMSSQNLIFISGNNLYDMQMTQISDQWYIIYCICCPNLRYVDLEEMFFHFLSSLLIFQSNFISLINEKE